MNSLFAALLRLAQLQSESISAFALKEVIDDIDHDLPFEMLKKITSALQVSLPKKLHRPDSSMFPILMFAKTGAWGVLRGNDYKGQWVVEWFDNTGRKVEETVSDVSGSTFFKMKVGSAFSSGSSPSFQLIKKEFFANRRSLFEVALGGGIINIVALAVSLYSMQVYDRVVPTGALATLQVLTIGVLLGIGFEFIAKQARAHLTENLVDKIDRRLARNVYLKFLSVRLDQLPPSVGGMAARMKGYETVRGFLSAALNYVVVDILFVVLYLIVIFALGGVLVVIPFFFLVCSILIGFFYLRRLEELAEKTTQSSNRKLGLLVEVIEGAETIKSGQAGWRMLGSWMSTTDEARSHDLEMRKLTERSNYITAMLQQSSYVLMVSVGAILIGNSEITIGSLIACSILSGRVLAPVAAIPGLLLQWGHSKAALKNLDQLWTLEDDHAGCETPIVLDQIHGGYEFKQVETSYNDILALDIPHLNIQAGEKIGILGPVGAGKTTILRLLSGMYKPSKGRLLLDGVDLSQISKPVLAEHVGYLQQDGRLFAGTLRDNLVLGLLDPGDSVILDAAHKSGLLYAVIQNHPQGLQLPIFEGGQGLSGGQRQLVNLTRVILREPRIWLLDEPTASMDQHLELKVRAMLHQEIKEDNTLVLITHKPEMLTLVDRILVVVSHKIVIDGPAKKVLEHLQRQRDEKRTSQVPTIFNGKTSPSEGFV